MFLRLERHRIIATYDLVPKVRLRISKVRDCSSLQTLNYTVIPCPKEHTDRIVTWYGCPSGQQDTKLWHGEESNLNYWTDSPVH